MIIYIGSALALIGLVFCFFWIKNARDNKDRGFAVFSLVGCRTVLIIGLWYISSKHDILCYAPSKEILNAKVEIDENSIEDSSILRLFNEIDSEMTPDDIERILGKDYTKDEYDGSVYMTYRTQHYTLNNIPSDNIVVEFKSNTLRTGTLILVIKLHVYRSFLFCQIADSHFCK